MLTIQVVSIAALDLCTAAGVSLHRVTLIDKPNWGPKFATLIDMHCSQP